MVFTLTSHDNRQKNEQWSTPSPTSSSRRSRIHCEVAEGPKHCLTSPLLQQQLLPAWSPPYTSVFTGCSSPSSGAHVAIWILALSLCMLPTLQSHGTNCSEGVMDVVCHQCCLPSAVLSKVPSSPQDQKAVPGPHSHPSLTQVSSPWEAEIPLVFNLGCGSKADTFFFRQCKSHSPKHVEARGCSWLGVFSSRRSFQMCYGLYIRCPLQWDLSSFCIKLIASHWGISWPLGCFSFFLIYICTYINIQCISKLYMEEAFWFWEGSLLTSFIFWLAELRGQWECQHCNVSSLW